jgi:hypothetical protein
MFRTNKLNCLEQEEPNVTVFSFICFSKYQRGDYAELCKALQYSILGCLKQNSYPTGDFHVKHMELTLVKFVKGLSENATRC